MDEGVKISKTNIWPNIKEMADSNLTVHSKNRTNAQVFILFTIKVIRIMNTLYFEIVWRKVRSIRKLGFLPVK